MRYETELMRSILTDGTAQQMIDWVSRLYGESYVALWLFQVMGTALTGPAVLAESLRSETSPATASRLLDLWEAHYELPTDGSLSDAARRARLILQSQIWGPCSPDHLAKALSNALGGAEVSIQERTDGGHAPAPYKFLVRVHGDIPTTVPAIRLLKRLTPAHLTPVLRVERTRQTPTVYVGVAVYRAGRRALSVPGIDPTDYTVLTDELGNYMIDESGVLLFD